MKQRGVPQDTLALTSRQASTPSQYTLPTHYTHPQLQKTNVCTTTNTKITGTTSNLTDAQRAGYVKNRPQNRGHWLQARLLSLCPTPYVFLPSLPHNPSNQERHCLLDTCITSYDTRSTPTGGLSSCLALPSKPRNEPRLGPRQLCERSSGGQSPAN